MRGITRETFGRLIDRKGGLAGVLMMAVGVWIVVTGDWQSVRMSFAASPDGVAHASADEIALHFLSTYASVMIAVICLLAVGLTPAMLKPGATWFYFSRPVSREKVLVEKVWAIVIVYVGLLIVSFVPVAAVASVKYALFDARLAKMILVHAFNCALWLTLICALGVLLRSAAKVIFVSSAIWLAQVLLSSRSEYLGAMKGTIIEPVLAALAFVLPRMSELSEGAHAIASGSPVNLLTPIAMTLLSVGLVLYLALASMQRQDL